MDAREVFVVKLAQKGIPSRTLSIDAENAHTLKLRTGEIGPGLGSIPVTVRYGEYADVDGLRLPSRIVTKNSFHGKAVIQYDTIRTDVPLPTNAFVLESHDE